MRLRLKKGIWIKKIQPSKFYAKQKKGSFLILPGIFQVHEATAGQLKRKHLEAVAEMSEQVAVLQKFKSKLEKERAALRGELEEVKSQVENSNKAKVSSVICGYSYRF
jgi:hypothetical protein